MPSAAPTPAAPTAASSSVTPAAATLSHAAPTESSATRKRSASPSTFDHPPAHKFQRQDPPSPSPSPSPILSRLAHPLASFFSSPYTSFPVFQQPQRLSTFSFDHDRTIHHDDRCKRFYRGPPLPPPPSYSASRNDRPPPRGADLNYGFSRFTQRDESCNEHLDALLSSLRHRTLSIPPGPARLEVDSARHRADVVTWRGIATKLCTAWDQFAPCPGARTEGFELNAMLLDETLYLEEHVSPSKRALKAAKEGDERLKRFGYYGYAFESWCTVEKEEDCAKNAWVEETPRQMANAHDGCASLSHPPGWGGDVNTNQQWCYIIKTRLGRNRLILAGEVDCVLPSPSPSDSLVELKTSMQIRPNNTRDVDLFEAKLLKFYMQSFLLGVRTLVVGFRDARGHLVTTQQFDTLTLPKMVRAGTPMDGRGGSGRETVLRQKSVWDPKDSVSFGDGIVQWLKEIVREEMKAWKGETADYPVFSVSFQAPYEEVTLRRLVRTEVESEVKEQGREERVGFLTREYYDFVREMESERHVRTA